MKTKLHRLVLKIPCLATVALAVIGVQPINAANILWVSDTSPLGFSGPGSGMTDSGFITILQNAGHNVMRWNSPDSQTTRLSAAELLAVNTNDLIIMGRAGASGQHQYPQSIDWNVGITKPLICMSPYFLRPDGGRLGWFTGGTLPDDVPGAWSAADSNNSAVDFLFGGVAMNGTNTASATTDMLDRNTSHMQSAPVAGAIVYSRATFANENGGAATTAYTIVGFPAGTIVRTNTDILAGYRMYLSGGTREGATTPNGIPQYTGRETLTPAGEDIFLRAVQLALNNGLPPVTDPVAPMAFTTSPTDVTVVENSAVTFSATVTGAGPRTLQWQRDIGDGVTFTNIPDAGTPFLKTELKLPLVTSADNNAKFILIASNPINAITSSVVTLTVTEDTTPPVPLSAASVNGNVIGVRFSEPLESQSAVLQVNYAVSSGGLDYFPDVVTLRPDGRTVALQMPTPMDPTFTVTVTFVLDLAGNEMPGPVTLNGTNLGLTSVEVGVPNPAGSEFAADVSAIEVRAGGVNILSTNDQFRFVHRTVIGDFDARVRVTGIAGTDRLESYAKAVLAARQSAETNAGNVTVFVTTPTPGDNSVGATIRNSVVTNQTSNLGAVVVPSGLPNAWIRITRAGNLFTAYRSTDGVGWTALGATNLSFGPSMLVGLGANAHRGGRLVTATFGDFSITQPPNPPTILSPTYAGGTFSGSFQTQNGFSYRVIYKDNLSAASWSLLTTIPGDGAVQPFNDPTPNPNQRFYRIEILP